MRDHGVPARPRRRHGAGDADIPDLQSGCLCGLFVTLKNLVRPRANGLTPRAIIEAFVTIQIVDVHLPTTDGRHLVLSRHTRPNKQHELLLHQIGMTLPQQPAPRMSV